MLPRAAWRSGLPSACWVPARTRRRALSDVRNLTQSPIHVRLKTDIGESYSLNDVQPAGSRRVEIYGRDKALWVEALRTTRR